MRLLDVKVSRVRVHAHTEVALDPRLTVLTGPNECGKSTLAEAMHAALFLKASGNTEAHRRLVSVQGGTPEVELRFEARGRVHRVHKRFGPKGGVTLATEGEPVLQGEEAERRLVELHDEETGRGRDAWRAAWCHLWCWQGEAGDDPVGDGGILVQRRDQLMQRLVGEGGAALLTSDTDHEVADRVRELRQQWYVDKGSPRAGSEPALAEARCEAARRRLEAAEAAVATMEGAVRELARAEEVLREGEREEPVIRARLEQARARAARVELLRGKHAERREALGRAEDALKALADDETRIAGLRRELAEAEPAALALGRERDALSAALTARRAGVAALEAEILGLEASEHRARAVLDHARARVDREEAARNLVEATTRHGEATAQEAEIAELRLQLAGLPEVDARLLGRLRNLRERVVETDASLRASATVVEVVESVGPVRVGEATIDPGAAVTLTSEAEVVAQGLRLRVRPGGGQTLDELREAAEEARVALAEALRGVGLTTLDEAVDAEARRSRLDQRIKFLAKQALHGGVAETARRLEEAQRLDARAAATLERRRTALGMADAAVLAIAVDRADEDYGAATERRVECRGRLDAERVAEEREKASLDEAGRRHEAHEQAARERRMRLALLLEARGDDAARGVAIDRARGAMTTVRAEVDEVEVELGALQPAVLEAELRQLQGALKRHEEASQQAREARGKALGRLASSGVADPEAELRLSRAEVELADRRRDEVRARGEAIRLLDRVFEDERARLAERFTRPFAEKVGGYLAHVFGPGTRASLEMAGDAFQGLRLERQGAAGATFRFEELSHGAREQVAVAVRLAMAEVLAADHDECLPVVLDDPFVNADPERLARVQSMLFHAAEQGLQVVVLSCDGSGYASLGAARVRLTPPIAPVRAVVAGAASVAVPVEAYEDRDEPAGRETTDVASRAGREPGPVATGDLDAEEGRFLAAIRAAEGGRLGNLALRRQLGLDEATYEAVKSRLLGKRLIEKGQGRGGTVGLRVG